ncbi:battenin CLN3 protein [Tulasnella sp. JGI-2019a]|nr:battenin CLN3 protein [Tulasnella sp. JGI-2019a]
MTSSTDEELSAPLLSVRNFGSSLDIERKLRLRLGISFFLFGLINNILYVVILSAALDLVPPSTPKGIIAFCNIAPALVAKIGWPYVLKGRIRYGKRLIGCCACSVLGMTVVALFDSLGMRLLGICLASFSSGLGELTFLQLSTTYPIALAGHAVGYFASGTGGAGVGGAGFWWEVRSLGVKKGVALSGILPFIIPLTYFFILPPTSKFAGPRSSSAAYSAVPTADPAEAEEEEDVADTDSITTATAKPRAPVVVLTFADKVRLVKPLVLKFMLPLFLVYTVSNSSDFISWPFILSLSFCGCRGISWNIPLTKASRQHLYTRSLTHRSIGSSGISSTH